MINAHFKMFSLLFFQLTPAKCHEQIFDQASFSALKGIKTGFEGIIQL